MASAAHTLDFAKGGNSLTSDHYLARGILIAALSAPEIEQPERREVPALTMMLAEAQVPVN
jgi:hypothetical protein